MDFYEKMLALVDGTRIVDLCGVEGTKRSTQCYGYEFLWHIVFGEVPEPPGREDEFGACVGGLLWGCLKNCSRKEAALGHRGQCLRNSAPCRRCSASPWRHQRWEPHAQACRLR